MGLKIAKWGIYRSTVAEAVLQTSSRITRGFERARRHVQSIPYPKTVVDGCCCRNTYSVFRKVPKLRTYSVFGMFFSWAEAPYLAAGSGNFLHRAGTTSAPLVGHYCITFIFLHPTTTCGNVLKLTLECHRQIAPT